jgi:hypothetical protein
MFLSLQEIDKDFLIKGTVSVFLEAEKKAPFL